VSLDLRLAAAPDPSRLTLGAFLTDAAARHRGRTALRFEGRDVLFDDLERGAQRVARALVGAGVVKGARVGVMMANRPEWVMAVYGAARLGAVVVPVNTFATASERDYILRHGDVSLLLLQRRLLRHAFLDDLLGDHAELRDGEPGHLHLRALPALRRVLCLGLEQRAGAVEPWSELDALGADVPDALIAELAREVRPSDEGILIYTSGTTANPKGVLHLQRAPVIQSYRFAELMGLTPEDRTVTAQPFFWTAGMAHSLGSHLAAGATLVIEEAFDPGRALALAEAERATMVIAWPHQEKAMAEHPEARTRDLSSLRKLEFHSPLARLVGLERDEWGVYGSFGMSETFTSITAHPASAPPEQRRDNGPPLPGMSVRIVDTETGGVLPPGERGEIAIRGVTFMRGYYKVEPEIYLDEDGYLHTRDGGYLDADGHLHWKGRLSGMIKTGGANVSPLEIEQALDGAPGVSIGFAVGVPHPTLGEIVALAAIPRPGQRVDEEAVRAHLRGALASYKVPRRVFSFERGQLAYTSTQKVQLEELRRKVLERLRSERAEVAGHVYE
jgi:acyl-CoA synthetase (AMP-forming)/AMP-acid ligase II